MERNPKRKKKATAFLSVSSIQCDVSDTMHVTKLGTGKKKKGKKLLHMHTKLSHNFNFMKNNSKVDESKIYETYIYIKKTISALSTGYFTFKGVWCSESFQEYCLSAHSMWPHWLKCVVLCL